MNKFLNCRAAFVFAVSAIPAVAQDFGPMAEIGHIAVSAEDPYIIQMTNGRSRTDQIIWMFENLARLEREDRTISGVQYTYRLVFAEGSEWSGTNALQLPDGTVWQRDGRIWTTSGVSSGGMLRIQVPRDPARDAVNLCVEVTGYTIITDKIISELDENSERRCSPESFRNFMRGSDWREGFGFPLVLLGRN